MIRTVLYLANSKKAIDIRVKAKTFSFDGQSLSPHLATELKQRQIADSKIEFYNGTHITFKLFGLYTSEIYDGN